MPESSQLFVVKKNGVREPFSEEKVMRSMKRVGVADNLQPKVLAHIKQRLHQDTETSEIFAHIKEFLDKNDQKASIRFNLKQAIFDLGPTGFPFERYMERVFMEMGYKTKVDQILRGQCVSHEIDVLLEKDGTQDIVEAKFHNQQGVKTDVQVLLYMYARFLDVKEVNHIESVWVVTNTKLTVDASNYAHCKGIKVIGWSFPESNNLQDYVEQPKLYPITILQTLSRQEKQSLLAGDVVLCRDFIEKTDHELMDAFFLDMETITKTKEAARLVLNTEKESTTPLNISPLL